MGTLWLKWFTIVYFEYVFIDSISHFRHAGRRWATCIHYDLISHSFHRYTLTSLPSTQAHYDLVAISYHMGILWLSSCNMNTLWFVYIIAWLFSYQPSYLAPKNSYQAWATHISPSPKDEGWYGWRGPDMNFEGQIWGMIWKKTCDNLFITHTTWRNLFLVFWNKYFQGNVKFASKKFKTFWKITLRK